MKRINITVEIEEYVDEGIAAFVRELRDAITRNPLIADFCVFIEIDDDPPVGMMS